MKNWKYSFQAASAVLLIHGAASAQVAPSQTSATQPSTTAAPMRSPSTPQGKTPKLVLPSSLEELLATSPFHLPPALVEWMRKTDGSAKLSQKGDLEASQGNWSDAVKDYQEALTLSADNSAALYGLGDDSLQHGNVADAVPYYRRAVYDPPETGTSIPLVLQPPAFRENNAFRVMEYARLLSLTGQQEEAQFVYRHGAQMINYMYGHPHSRLMLPDFGDGAGQIAFTPQRLQALAQAGWAEDHSDFDMAGAGARLQQSVALFPDSPVPYYYRARYTARHGHDFKAVKADFDKAAQLGDAAAIDAVEQERHFFRHSLGPAAQASQQTKPSP